jgi:S-adenosylhomocysteine hydrolase
MTEGDLVSPFMQNVGDQVKEIMGGCEETTTGILRPQVNGKERINSNFP